jgi:hypothetical protein
MLSPIGFWSYSNSDDDHSRGRLSQLRALLASELQQKIGRHPKVNIFQDVAAIPPGAEWEKQIRDAINGSFFLIPIVTPALLQSEWCCQEITLFRQREATTLRRTDLIFPLHYLNVDDRDPLRTEDCHDAEVFSFLRRRQWTDFRTLRHIDPESEDVARKIDGLADAIWSALRRAERDLYAEEQSRQKVTAQEQYRVREDKDRREGEIVRITFPVSFDLPRAALQAQARVYLGGSSSTFFVDQTNPSATAIFEVDGSGQWAYRIEEEEILPADSQNPYPHKIRRTRDDKIHITKGIALKVELGIFVDPAAPLTSSGQFQMSEVIMLMPVLSPAEKKEAHKKFMEILFPKVDGRR